MRHSEVSRQDLIKAMKEYAIAWITKDELAGVVTDREELILEMADKFAFGRTDDDLVCQVINDVLSARYN
jgi:hypothetical protein